MLVLQVQLFALGEEELVHALVVQFLDVVLESLYFFFFGFESL